VILHGYWRSSAAYRVRIALNLKQLSVEHAFHHLRRNEQRGPDYLRLNPQGLLPALELDSGRGVLTQSLAICEWLEETHPEPRLLPRDPVTRAHIRGGGGTGSVRGSGALCRRVSVRRDARACGGVLGATADQCPTFWGRPVGLSEAARGRAGLPGAAGFHGRCAGAAARRGARLSRRSRLSWCKGRFTAGGQDAMRRPELGAIS